MKDLLEVVKEATNTIRNKYSMNGNLFTDEQLHDIKKIVKETYIKQSFWWKLINPIENYKQMIILDFQYNFMGGGVLKKGEDTIIEIR